MRSGTSRSSTNAPRRPDSTPSSIGASSSATRVVSSCSTVWSSCPTGSHGSGEHPGPTATSRSDAAFSYVKYELVRTYVGAVADVEVDRRTGAVRVNRFFVAHDCGQIINPDGLKNQIEGNVVQTVSRTLIEQLTFDRGKVTSIDWATYPILTFPDLPEVKIDLIDRPTEKPWGAGEPTAAIVPAAIANAIFDATGARVRSVPFTREKVLAAIGRYDR